MEAECVIVCRGVISAARELETPVIIYITFAFIVCEQLSVIYKPEWIQINNVST